MSATMGSFIVAAIALLLSLANTLKKDAKTDSAQIATMMVKLDRLSDDIREIKSDMGKIQQGLQDNHDRVLILERDLATMWKRVDELRDDVESIQQKMPVATKDK